jgi:hypothetical protein
MSKSLLKLGNNAIMFGDPSCPACLAQYKLLSDKFSKQNGSYINYYDLSKYKVPSFLTDREGNYSMPTWYLPSGNSKGKLFIGIISSPAKFNKLLSTRNTKFGDVIPQINTLTKNGKAFPDGKGFNIQDSFANKIMQQWGSGDNMLKSGTLGREFGPGGTDKIYSNGYYNNIRMGVPGGDLDTALNLNARCNIVNNPKAIDMSPGMIYNSPNPQIVNFGRKTRFGCNTAPSYSNPKLITNSYTGAMQNGSSRPTSVNSRSIIGQASDYTTQFGKKKKVGPGSILSIKNNKIKIKN